METTQKPLNTWFINFFGFDFKKYLDWTFCRAYFENVPLDQKIGEKLFLIYTRFEKQKQALKNLKKVYTEEMQRRTHRKHCYQRAIAEHQNTTNHLRRQIRAFEQLAKANEESRKELERNKRNWGFSIWAEK